MKKLFALCLLMMATVTLSAKTIKEFVVTTQPQMSCQNCENKIKKNLRFEKGVTNIRTDLQNQLVVVTYDADKTNEANITEAFGKLNYTVTPVDAANPAPAANGNTSCPKASDCNAKTTCPNTTDCAANTNCSKEKAACKQNGKKCDGKGDKKCDGKCSAKDANCKDGNCKDNSCKKDDTSCKNKKK
ncbi:MAG: heavy-metal-associated domain-containing protein [Muribaculaceae bacterium]|nr:heavy-metal-associated domain-containing protein [Muribaculaceae bacterium]